MSATATVRRLGSRRATGPVRDVARRRTLRDLADERAPRLIAGTVSRTAIDKAWATFEETGDTEYPLLGAAGHTLVEGAEVLVGRDQRDRTWLLNSDTDPTDS